jgi:hypothetical protein
MFNVEDLFELVNMVFAVEIALVVVRQNTSVSNSFKKSDKLVCFVLWDAISVWGTSISFHVTSDKSNIFLNVLAVPRPEPA